MRSDMMSILEAKCQKRNQELNEDDMLNFFGLYANNTNKFQFMGGERKLLLRMVEYLKGKIQTEPDHFSDNLHKISPKDTVLTSAGLFFGAKEKNDSNQSRQPHNMKGDLYRQLKQLCDSSKLQPVHLVSEDNITIVNAGNRIRADVICPFCPQNTPENQTPKTVSVQSFISNSNAMYWTLSNFKKHLKQHNGGEKLHKRIKVEQNCESEITNAIGDNGNDDSNDKENDKPELMETTVTCTDYSSFENQVYAQLSNQILEMSKIVLTNNNAVENMAFILNNKAKFIQVTKILGDGNCLYSSFSHQIFGHEVKSDDMKKSAEDLRASCVKHIKMNFDRYYQILRGRVYENYEMSGDNTKLTDDLMATECESFLNDELPLKKCYGGAESISAISEMYKVNVLCFAEKAEFFFCLGFNPEYRKTVCLAYRLGAKVKGKYHHNHYDSVTGIQSDILYDCSKELCRLMYDKEEVKDEFIEIDDSF